MRVDTERVRLWARQTVIALAAGICVPLVTVPWQLMFTGATEASGRQLASMLQADTALLYLISALLIAPFVETLFMAWVILLLLDAKVNRLLVLVTSALIWGAVHLLVPIGWFAAPGFVVLSALFIWRNTPSHKDAFIVTSMAHFYANVIACGSMIAFNPALRM